MWSTHHTYCDYINTQPDGSDPSSGEKDSNQFLHVHTTACENEEGGACNDLLSKHYPRSPCVKNEEGVTRCGPLAECKDPPASGGAACGDSPFLCANFPPTGPWIAFYHGPYGSSGACLGDKYTDNPAYPVKSDDTPAAAETKIWNLWKKKSMDTQHDWFMKIPDPEDTSKYINAIISSGHGSFGGKCGDIALYKYTDKDDIKYIINFQNGMRSASLELTKNTYIPNNGGGFVGIPIGIPLSGEDEYGNKVTPYTDLFTTDTGTGEVTFKSEPYPCATGTGPLCESPEL